MSESGRPPLAVESVHAALALKPTINGKVPWGGAPGRTTKVALRQAQCDFIGWVANENDDSNFVVLAKAGIHLDAIARQECL